ncbi:MAG: methylmalonyl-CoA mutase family protein [Flavobacteriales bacterium]
MNSQLTFDEFDKISMQEWLKIAEKELKGNSPEQILNWTVEKNISAHPYPEASRVYSSFGKSTNDWAVIEKIEIPSFTEANKTALLALNNGATGLHFDVPFLLVNDLEELFKNILLEHITVFIKITSFQQAEVFFKWITEQKHPTDSLVGGLLFNPFSEAASKGEFNKNLTEDIVSIAKLAQPYSRFKCFSAGESIYHHGGASLVESTAFGFSEAVEFIQIQIENGISIDDAAANVLYEPIVGSCFLPEIARMRAVKHIWSKIIEAYNPMHNCSKYAYLYASTSKREIALPDSYNNLLRGTSQAMSAVIAGVDALHVESFDSLNKNSTFGKRIARNTQLLLEHESFLDKVSDPSKGSRYVESLTENFIKKAWLLFCEVQDLGGIKTALERNFIQWKVKHSASLIANEIAEGKKKVIGVNIYPNAKEDYLEEINTNTSSLKDFEAISPVYPYSKFVKPVNA